ncbi:hypothetical protein [Enterocloster bolteae]|nr:hypothetical protein [Enterocloster bolteae]
MLKPALGLLQRYFYGNADRAYNTLASPKAVCQRVPLEKPIPPAGCPI